MGTGEVHVMLCYTESPFSTFKTVPSGLSKLKPIELMVPLKSFHNQIKIYLGNFYCHIIASFIVLKCHSFILWKAFAVRLFLYGYNLEENC